MLESKKRKKRNGIKIHEKLGSATPMGTIGSRINWLKAQQAIPGYNIIGEDKFLKNVPFRLLKGTIIVLFDAV